MYVLVDVLLVAVSRLQALELTAAVYAVQHDVACRVCRGTSRARRYMPTVVLCGTGCAVWSVCVVCCITEQHKPLLQQPCKAKRLLYMQSAL
jgi:hypothetical protein